MGPDMGRTNRSWRGSWIPIPSIRVISVSEIVTGKPVAIGGTEGRREATGAACLPGRAGDEHVENGFRKNVRRSCRDWHVWNQWRLSPSDTRAGSSYCISDAHAAIYNPKGIDSQAAEQHILKKGTLRAFAQDDHVDPNELLTKPCDILVPAAVDRVINGKNAGQLKCRILAEAANGPTNSGGRPDSGKRWDDIFVIPDILCTPAA
jgi:glutamate dehydrogenase (NAD(P)+)